MIPTRINQSKKLRYWQVRPTRAQKNTPKPCTPEINQVFNCWKLRQVDAPECEGLVASFKSCIQQSHQTQRIDNSTLNEYLNKVMYV